tara:strand:+ start:454 stop:768 length:315 start_codon:yes stop_codon:yes gene_type:complete
MDKQMYKVMIAEYMERESKLNKKVLELEKENMELREDFRRLHRLYTFGTPTDGLEVGSPSDYEVDLQLNLFEDDNQINIFESPDGGKTVYERNAGSDDRKKIKG